MRRVAFMAGMLICLSDCFGQSPMIAKYKDSLNIEKADTNKAKFLYKLSYYYSYYKPDSALLLAYSSYNISKHTHFAKGESTSLGLIGLAFNRLGNYSKALEYYLEQLKILEKNSSAEDIATAYLSIALVYNSQKDISNALKYAYKADSIAKNQQLAELMLYTLLDIGDMYANNNQLDSALVYTIRCLDSAIIQKNVPIKGTALNNLGNIYFKKGAYPMALVNYKNSVPYLKSAQDNNTLAECTLGLAKTFDKTGAADSALYYANESFKLASDNQFLKNAISVSSFLTDLYKKNNKIDSAFTYQGTYLILKDSFDNSEKIKQLQNLTISEQLRQQQIAEQQLEEHKERNERLQLFLIAIFIPILFIISLYISKRRVNRKIIRVSGILSLLFLFEFITLLIHPLVANSANHSPLIEMLILVAIAAFILPAHHNVEHWLVLKLTQRHEFHLTKMKAKTTDTVRQRTDNSVITGDANILPDKEDKALPH